MNYTLDKNDIEMLKLVYKMRCLTIKQVYHRCYEQEITLEELTDKILQMEQENYIKIINFAGSHAILISDNGYKFLKDTVLTRELIDEDSGKTKKGYNTPRENNLQTKAINHQVHLNEFVIQFEDNLKEIPLGIESEYFDEKNVSKYDLIRPDGLLSTKYGKNKIDFFLEMDMATETAKQLEEKWTRYKNFMKSNKSYTRNERIVVLFIIANTDKIEERKRLVMKTILEKFEGFSPKFEIYIGEKDYLLNLMFDLIINKPDYKFYLKQIFENKFNLESKLTTDICSLNTYRNKIFNYIEYNNTIFLYDDYSKEGVSILDKIQHIMLYIQEIKEKYHQKAFYLINVNDIDKLFTDMTYLNLTQFDNLVFINVNELSNKPFNEVIYTILKDGSIMHFKNDNFEELTFERNIKEK